MAQDNSSTPDLNVAQRFVAWLARVVAVPVGKENDGLVLIERSGTGLDKPWGELRQEFADALEAWRYNPLARRLVGMVSAYVVGDGIVVKSKSGWSRVWLEKWAAHPENQVILEQASWCDELTRSGELFFALFMADDGMVYVRPVPATMIARVEWQPGDYRAELRYHEVAGEPGGVGTVWHALRDGAVWNGTDDNRRARPIMAHYAINRPVGHVRGESDLKPILPWLRRYSRWLEDRVVLNSSVRSFIWIVKVPARLVASKIEQYRRPPEPGSVMVVDRENEEWSAVAPNIGARDAASDGRAIRWMITAGGPGTGLVDLGEGEDANLATASAMGEQRRRFLRRRQQLFGMMLQDLALISWNWGVELGVHRGKLLTADDLEVVYPDIAPADNQALALAARDVVGAVEQLAGITGESSELKRLALRLMLKFAGESVSEEDFNAIVLGTAKGANDGQNTN